MLIPGIDLRYNIFSNICLQHQHYTENGTVYLSILFPWIVFFCPDQTHHFCGDIFSDCVEIPWELNSGHQWIYIVIINSIDSIYNLFIMTRCTYDSINYNGVTLRHNWHKVHCRGTSVLFSTTISASPYCTKWCCQ